MASSAIPAAPGPTSVAIPVDGAPHGGGDGGARTGSEDTSRGRLLLALGGSDGGHSGGL